MKFWDRLKQKQQEVQRTTCETTQNSRSLTEDVYFLPNPLPLPSRASAENFPGGGQRKKIPKISKKKYRKIALFNLFQGGNGKKPKKLRKKAEK